MRTKAGIVALAFLAMASLPYAAAGADSKPQRSAQGQCQREAERRGYAVLASRNYQQLRDGWSMDLQARDYKGRVTWGTCFVETRTGDVSLYGFGWGGSNAGATFDFYCASPDYKYRECQLPVDGRATLVKKKSDASCVEGRDWGQRGDRVWVNNGCRANFQVVRRGSTVKGEPAVAERACFKEIERQGLRLVSKDSTHSIPGGYGVSMTVRRGNQPPQPLHCAFLFSTGRATLNY